MGTALQDKQLPRTFLWDKGTFFWDTRYIRYKSDYDAIFERLEPVGGLLTGAKAKKELLRSRLPNSVLARIWRLADLDRDGQVAK